MWIQIPRTGANIYAYGTVHEASGLRVIVSHVREFCIIFCQERGIGI